MIDSSEHFKYQMKLLITGSVYGRLGLLDKRIQLIQKEKNTSFDAVICTGNFFPDRDDFDLNFSKEGNINFKRRKIVHQNNDDENDWQSYIYGSEKKFPIPLYFIKGSNQKPKLNKNGQQIGTNLFFLGNSGVKTNLEGFQGLKIAFGDNVSFEKDFISQGMSVDIFLTCKWPKDILHELPFEEHSMLTHEAIYSANVRNACEKLLPRYHFASCIDLYYPRIPFKTKTENGTTRYTRFISLGFLKNENNDYNRKWLHGLSLLPLDINQDMIEPTQFTANPFNQCFKQKNTQLSFNIPKIAPIDFKQKEEIQPSQFMLTKPPYSNFKPNNNKKCTRFKISPRGNCWYCLASHSCEKHLIVSVFEDVYVCLPKGGLSAQHCQLIPVSHVPSLSMLNQETIQHMNLYKSAIIKYFTSFDCFALFFERNIPFDKALQCHAFFTGFSYSVLMC